MSQVLTAFHRQHREPRGLRDVQRLRNGESYHRFSDCNVVMGMMIFPCLNSVTEHGNDGEDVLETVLGHFVKGPNIRDFILHGTETRLA